MNFNYSYKKITLNFPLNQIFLLCTTAKPSM